MVRADRAEGTRGKLDSNHPKKRLERPFAPLWSGRVVVRQNLEAGRVRASELSVWAKPRGERNELLADPSDRHRIHDEPDRAAICFSGEGLAASGPRLTRYAESAATGSAKAAPDKG